MIKGLSKLRIVKSSRDIDKLIEYVKQTKYCSLDFETTGTEFYEEQVVPTILGISFQPGSAYIIPLAHKESKFRHKYKRILYKIGKAIMEDYDIVKIAWNGKFEYKWFLRYGIEIKGRFFDGMLAKYLLDEERPMGLKEFVRKIFPSFAGYEEEVKKIGFNKMGLKDLAKYCGIDCDVTLRAMMYMEPKLIKLGFYPLFRNLLMMGVRVLAESEFNGVRINREYLSSLMVKYEGLIADEESKLYKNPRLVRYDNSSRKQVNNLMIATLQQEIADISKGESKQKARMISSRKDKINQIIAGKFRGKVGKLKSYESLNLNSPIQLADLLFLNSKGFKFKIVKYTVNKKTKKPTTTPSTDESVLMELKDKDGSGLIDQLLKYRELTKLYSTYIKGINEIVSSQGRVHASFQLHGTVTGRLSCVEPNLQNIPRDTTASDIKKMFLPEENQLLLEVDYGQAELRVLAEMAADKAMIEIFDRGFNIHLATACKQHFKSLDNYNFVKSMVSKAESKSGEELERPENKELLFWAKQKKKAKTINFGIVYGQGDPKLAEGMGVPVEEATEFRIGWFKAFPQAVEEIERLQKMAQTKGYVLNMFGRKRRLPDAMFRDKWEAKRYNMMGKFLEALRQAVNAPIQGTASDFGLLSQIVIRKYKKLGWLPRNLVQLYTVHDSIGYSIMPKYIHYSVPIIVKICDNPETLKYFGFELQHVKMKVSQEVGLNWGEIKAYDNWKNYQKILEN